MKIIEECGLVVGQKVKQHDSAQVEQMNDQ
jgi:hypothetical protein